MIATETVGLAESIIDDTPVLYYLFCEIFSDRNFVRTIGTLIE